MRGSWSRERRVRVKRIVFACSVTLAMLGASLASISVIAETAEARGPAYSGPQTQSSGPAFFGPAPNPFPYCDSPTYFDPFEENLAPIGRMDVGDTATVTTDSITMDLVITGEGNPGTQYPGFFPQGGDGGTNDQPKGIELAEGDAATVTLTEPLFYSQWIFTDVDQPNEGFTVTPTWTVPGQAAAFGGDNQFTFAGTTPFAVELDDLNGQAEDSESINGRVQVDFLGAVTGIQMERTFPSNGQSGFAVGGGCEAVGAAKAVVAGPTWNGDSYDVTYELRMRNNLPSSGTIQAVINDAVAGVGASLVTGTPQGIILNDLQLTDDLRDPAFSSIEVTDRSTTGGLDLNESFDGQTDFELLDGGAITAETDEVITLSVRYTPDLAQAAWSDCQAGFTYLNQTTVTASAANVPVSDVSDDGVNAAPSNNNGSGGVDDPTPVLFDCPPGELEIVKTVVPGPNGTCPTFELGVPGPGPAFDVTVDDVVTYCISVRNIGPGPVFNVNVSDPQAPSNFAIPDLNAGEGATVSYDIVVAISTPPENVATVTGTDSSGPVGPVSDPALINPTPKPLPVLEIVKTVVPGPNGQCPTFELGVPGLGPALQVLDTDIVTYCVSVRNTGPGDATNVVISDPQAPQAFALGTLTTGQGATESYDVQVEIGTTPLVNLATASFSGPDGPLPSVSDDAQIAIDPLQPNLEIVKTAFDGSGVACPLFLGGTPGLGAAVVVDDRDPVTYCVTVRNLGPGIATDIVVTDAQAPGPLAIGTLGPDEEATVSYEIIARLTTDPVNTATANGNGPDGPLPGISDQAQIMVDALPDPGLQIVKTAIVGPNGNCPSFAGGTVDEGAAVPFLETETVTYCISVRNVGPGPATDVVLADPQAPNTFDLNIGNMAVGDEVTRSYDIANLMVGDPTRNVATATGNGLNGALDPVSDPALISIALQPDPILEIVKTVVPGPNGNCPANFLAGQPGDGPALPVLYTETVTYCISVRNVGGNPATAVTVSDTQAPGPLNLGTIPVGEERGAQYNVLVDANTPERNTATAVGQGPNGQVGPVSDTALIASSQQPDPVLDIVKTVVAAADACPTSVDTGERGDGTPLPVLYEESVKYCITVKNIGENPATDVVVTDPQAPAPGSFDLGGLAINEEKSVSYLVLVDAATPLRNTATATGQGPNGQVGPVSDTALIVSSPQPDPVLDIVKTVVKAGEVCPTSVDTGVRGLGTALEALYDETVTYCITVKNIGENPATDVVVTDPQAPAPGLFNLNTLAIDEEKSVSYDVLIDANTPDRNTATVIGQGPNGQVGPVSDPALITTDPQPNPVLEIVKTVVAGPNGTCPATFDLGVPGDGDPLVVSYGETVTYCVTVRNIAGNPATNVVVSDPQAPGGSISLGTINVGEEKSESYDVANVDENTPLQNTATAVGEGPNGDLDPVSDTALITPAQPVLEIVKTAVAGPQGVCPAFADGAPGDGEPLQRLYTEVVTYCITVKNTGGNPASGVVITDDQAPAGSFDGDIGTLDPDDEVTRSFDVTVDVDTPLRNIATTTGTGPGNVPIPEVSDPAVIETAPLPDPVLEIVKTVVPGPGGTCPATFDDGVDGLGPALSVKPDRTVTYCVAIRNSGAGDATDVEIIDPQAGSASPFVVGDLDAGDGVSVEYDVVISVGTPLVNTAVVTGTGPNSTAPGDITDSDQAQVELDLRSASIALIHSVSKTEECITEAKELNSLVADREDLPITWCAKITNTGNVDLVNVILTVPEISNGPIDVLDVNNLTVLPPGESTFIFLDGAIPNEGQISPAGVSGDPALPDGTPITDLDTQEDFDNAFVLEAQINIESTVIAGPDGDCDNATELAQVAPGDVVTWCYTVTNVGFTVLRVDEVTDSVLNLTIPVPPEDQRLGLGDSFVVKEDVVATGPTVNDGDVKGQPIGTDEEPLDAPEVTDNDDAAIEVPQADLSIVKTNSNNGPLPAGSDLTYTLLVTNKGPGVAEGVKVVDSLPGGLIYLSVPSLDGWVCALDGDDRGFSCLKSEPMAADETATLTYRVRASGGTPFIGVSLVNTATVTSDTPDPDPSDNTDESPTFIPNTPVLPPPPPIGPEPLPPAPPLAPPDEVLELVITGAASNLLAAVASIMLAIGGVFTVGARRGRDEHDL